jgi:hypothetical protein
LDGVFTLYAQPGGRFTATNVPVALLLLMAYHVQGTIVSAIGVYLSLVLDLPTGATIVCTFGIVLLSGDLRLLIRRTATEAPTPCPRGSVAQ